MSGERHLCRRISDRALWDTWASSGLPVELQAHAARCNRCRPLAAEIAFMGAGLTGLARATAADSKAVSGASIADNVLAAITTEATANPGKNSASHSRQAMRSGRAAGHSIRRRRLIFVPMAAAALVLVLAIVRLARPPVEQMRIDAPDGALVATPGDRGRLRGIGLSVPIPAHIRTLSAQRAAVQLGQLQTALGPDSALYVSDSRSLRLDAGRVTARAAQPFELTSGPVRIAGQGQMAVARISPAENGVKSMKLSRKHGVLATMAVAVAVYTGWATLSSGTSKTRIEAPGGAVVGEDGKVRRFALTGAGQAGDALARIGAQSASLSSPPNRDQAATPAGSGAVWDDNRELFLFAVPGQVFDAHTGQPIPDFRITARATDSLAYGQARPKNWTFRDRPEGEFRIPGVGVGRWQITVRAPEYAPLVQMLDLSDLTADPYVLAPLSSGAQLSGRVIDWRDRPVAGAEVGLAGCLEPDQKPDVTSCTVRTSRKDGTFYLDGIPEGQVFAIHARHPRHGQATVKNLTQTIDQSRHVIIRLSGVVRITGEVTRGHERHPVVGATVMGPGGVRAASDHNGVYEMFTPLDRRLALTVEIDSSGTFFGGRVSATQSSDRDLVWVDAATHVAEARVDFRLAMESGRLYGRVADSTGQPLANIELDLAYTSGWMQGNRVHETFPARTRTDGEGRYQIDHIPIRAGYRVRYRLSGDSKFELLGYVNVRDETPVQANFQLGAGTIRGRFVNADSGQPFSLSSMTCSRMGARHLDSGGYYYLPTCYADGRFEFEGLPPGQYQLHNRLSWMDSPVRFHQKTVVLAPGQIAADVRIAVEGSQSDLWQFRILDQNNRFLSSPFIRYHQGRTMFTENLDIGPDGIARHSVNRRYKSIFIENAGHDPAPVNLDGRDPGRVIDVRLSKTSQDSPSE